MLEETLQETKLQMHKLQAENDGLKEKTNCLCSVKR